MADPNLEAPFTVAPFVWGHWPALWVLRTAQLAEAGVVVPLDIPEIGLDVPRDGYEWEYHHMAEVFLAGAGGFWLAWVQGEPAGHAGAQDLGGVIELRNMYVRREFRRRGIGTRLVRALLDHCLAKKAAAVELWTGKDGPGRKLYESLGFRITVGPGAEYIDLVCRTNYTPGDDEIHMRIDLCKGEQQ